MVRSPRYRAISAALRLKPRRYAQTSVQVVERLALLIGVHARGRERRRGLT